MGFLEWFSIITGAATLISLAIVTHAIPDEFEQHLRAQTPSTELMTAYPRNALICRVRLINGFKLPIPGPHPPN
jgi:hypothetical protein